MGMVANDSRYQVERIRTPLAYKFCGQAGDSVTMANTNEGKNAVIYGHDF